MKHASTRQVFDYWNERRGERIAPERGDIEPGPIRGALGDTFILGQNPDGRHYFRLAGTRMCALFCRELKGESFLALWEKTEQAAMRDYLTVVATESAGVVTGAVARNRDNAPIVLELMLLPLTHRDRSQARLLGVLAPIVVPSWLGASPIENLTCGTVRHLGPATATVASPRLVPSPGHGPDNGNGRLRHGLVVYDGGRS